MKRVWVLLICLGVVSCGSNKYGEHPPYPVTGQLLVNGQPAKGAVVILRHKDDWGEKTIVPMAWTEDEGQFTLSTYASKDGAPAGEYLVEVHWPGYKVGRNIGPDKLGGKYADPDKSGLTVLIEEQANELNLNLEAELVDVPPFQPGKRLRGRQ